MNATAVSFVKAHEGCKLEAYQDSVGVWTIGYGHTAGVKEGEACSQAQADEWLAQDLDLVRYNLTNWLRGVNLSEKQEAAILSLSFNVGSLGKSQLIYYVNQRMFINAAKEFPKWDHAGKMEIKGLLIRRFDEASLFLQGS